MHRRSAPITMFLIMQTAAMQLFASVLGWSGTWILDVHKSRGLPPGVKQTLIIKQESTTIEIETQTERNGKTQATHETLILDGKPHQVPSQHFTLGLKGTATRTAVSGSDSRGIEVTDAGEYASEFGPVSDLRKRSFSLSADGSALTVHTHLQGAIAEVDSIKVYTRGN